MNKATLEHVNITVTNPDRTADMLCQLFDWQIRWRGPSKMGGHTIHVGPAETYLAIYSTTKTQDSTKTTYETTGGLNHIGIVVDDLAAAEARITAAGFKTHNHGDYEPGKRFYFNDQDQIEYEIISYA